MKVALANLPNREKVVRRFRCNVFTGAYLLPPIELITLAGIHGECIFIDAIAEGMGEKEFSENVLKQKPDVLVFLAGFETLEREIESVQILRRNGIKVGCLGYLPSLFPERVLEKGIDFVIAGEPERAFGRIVRMKKEDVGGVYRSAPLDMGKMPIPDYRLMRGYFDVFLPKPFATIESSRGCPYSCIYCIKPFGRKIRRKPVERVLEELKILEKMGFKCARFVDDLFMQDAKWVRQLCSGIIGSGLRMKFVCLTRPDNIDRETVKIMKSAGFVRFLIGIESGSDRLLKFYKRGYSRESLFRNLKIVREQGIETIGWFIVSSRDSRESLKESYDVTRNLDWIVVSVLEPRPGTEIFDKCAKSFSLFPYKTEFTKEDSATSKKLAKRLLLRFYASPRQIARVISASLRHPKAVASLFVRTARHFLLPDSGLRPDIF